MATSLTEGFIQLDGQELADPYSRTAASLLRTRESQNLEENTDNSASSIPSRLHVTIRRATLADLPSLSRMPEVLQLQQPELSLTGYRVGLSTARSFAPWNSSRPMILVAKSGDRSVGFAHFQAVGSDHRWFLVGIGSGTGVYDPHPVWTDLLSAGVQEAGLEGVKRLYARAPVGSAAGRALADVGYAPYAEETILVADAKLSLQETLSAKMQEPSDTWAIHQLYNSSVPKHVLYAEARTSHYWDISHVRFSRGAVTKGWLVEDSYVPIAYVRSTLCGPLAMLEVTYAPGSAGTAAALVDTVIRRLRQERRLHRIFCPVRAYQQELGTMLAHRGFEPILGQHVFIKYTTALVRSSIGEPVPIHSEGVERLPSRVPTFFQGTTGDSS
jgi:hypothetical protein